MTDQTLLTALQYALVEAPNGGASWPSHLWTRDEVLGSVNQRQSRLLKESLLLITRLEPLTVGIGQTRVALPADLLRIVDLVWRGSDGIVRDLQRSEAFEVDHMIPTWETAQTAPLVYMEYDALTLEVQIAPACTVEGTLEILYVPKGTEVAGNGTPLAVPDEWAHLLKYGVLADLLGKDGRGQDLARAQYAEDRFQLGIELTRILLEGWA